MKQLILVCALCLINLVQFWKVGYWRKAALDANAETSKWLHTAAQQALEVRDYRDQAEASLQRAIHATEESTKSLNLATRALEMLKNNDHNLEHLTMPSLTNRLEATDGPAYPTNLGATVVTSPPLFGDYYVFTNGDFQKETPNSAGFHVETVDGQRLTVGDGGLVVRTKMTNGLSPAYLFIPVDVELKTIHSQ